jgi:ubiquinone/menaquinone biosynthesis C-methylase UbiE
MSQLEFDEQEARDLEAMYELRDARRRRELARAALAAAPGERILDVGCGPGFYCAELLAEVGESGWVTGVDSSAAMLSLAARRCAGHDNVELLEGEAGALPVPEESFDAALSVQVIEYVADLESALADLRRVLRPGGRVLIWDIDWDTVSVHAEDLELSERVMRAWDEHLAHRTLPRMLAGLLRAAGFVDVSMTAHAFAPLGRDPESWAAALVPFIGAFVGGRGGVSEEEAEAWVAGQRRLAERGDFYFACTQFCFTARKPL